MYDSCQIDNVESTKGQFCSIIILVNQKILYPVIAVGILMKHKMQFKSLRSGPRQLFFLIIIAMVGLVVLFQLTEYSRLTQPMSYSTFLKNVEADNVKSVQIVGQRAYGQMRDNKTRFETVLPDNNPQQWALLREHNVDLILTESSSATAGWYWFGLFGLLFLGGILWFLIKQSRGSSSSSSNIFSMGKSRAKIIMPSQVKINFSQVAGAQDAKSELMDVVDFLKNPEKFKRLGAKLPRGILLVGEPGNGKTLLAKAIAGEANCPFFMVSGSDFVEVFVGVGAARIRDLFAQARKTSPCIVFIDEIDAIGRQRGTGLGGGNDEREQTLNQLLTEMDGFESQGVPLVVIAATNIPDVLDKALLRPGRFDQRIDVPFPDTKAREEIIKIQAREIKLSSEVDVKRLAEETAGFSGADIANLVNQAALIASKKNHDIVMASDLEEARIKLFKSQETQNKTGALQNKTSVRAKLFMPSQVKTKFEDVAGIKEAKEEVFDVVDFLKNPSKYKRLGAKIPRGVLLVGEPGNGKTLLARAIAGESNCPFFSVSGSDFVEMYVGVGAARVRELFSQAKKNAPCIIFIDEIDSLGGHRTTHGGGQEHDQTLNQLLTEMDGFDVSPADIIVIGATNRIDMLDKALLRPGRFDRQVKVPYPDISAREDILRVHAKRIKLDSSVDFHKLARGTPGFSGADLANLINEAAIAASKKNQDVVTVADLDEARDKVILGKEMRSIVLSPKELKMTAYHEAGHALIRLLLPDVTEPLFKVTIVPRGMSLGATHWLPEREKYISTREEMVASIMSALGGRIAEEITFSALSTGASNDFAKATDMARSMVCDYGMSEKLGPLVYSPDSRGSKSYSEETANKIDDEIRSIIQTCYEKAKSLLLEHRDKLEKLAMVLLEKETVQAQEIYDLLQIEPRGEHSIQ